MKLKQYPINIAVAPACTHMLGTSKPKPSKTWRCDGSVWTHACAGHAIHWKLCFVAWLAASMWTTGVGTSIGISISLPSPSHDIQASRIGGSEFACVQAANGGSQQQALETSEFSRILAEYVQHDVSMTRTNEYNENSAEVSNACRCNSSMKSAMAEYSTCGGIHETAIPKNQNLSLAVGEMYCAFHQQQWVKYPFEASLSKMIYTCPANNSRQYCVGTLRLFVTVWKQWRLPETRRDLAVGTM